MDETHWDIQEVKRWKIKQLVQYNLGALLLFVLLTYFIEYVQLYFLIGFFYILVLMMSAMALYSFKTGRFIGTKTNRRIQEFEKAHLGKKRWKRRKVTEAVFITVLIIFFTAFIVITESENSRLDFSSMAFPFIGAWLGYNIGEIVRMRNL
ncbi:hypothetical protein DHX103_07335 [Planococcus sp. X10-3]|uniref:hypothetical protein n=1 Tax=Planococcus sp. X10-3 TaxID=3061240 RepID=UPI003BB0900F